jgi:type IV secretion system protein VirB10
LQLHSQLFNAQRAVAAPKGAAESASPLTPPQMQPAAGGGTLPSSMFPSNSLPTPAATSGVAERAVAQQGQRLPGSYNPDAPLNATRRPPDKPATLVTSYRQEDLAASSKEQAPISQSAGSLVPKAQGSAPPAAASVAAGLDAPADASANLANHNPTFAPRTANPEDQQHQLAAAAGEKYRIREGTWLPCTEQLRINGFFAGNINCLISIPIYSTSGAHLLIPQGTVALGHAAAVSGQNQQRLFVVFDELIMPDGYTVNYDNAAGLDQIGQTGLRDKVNHHYIQMFGVSVGLAAISGLSQIGNYGNSAITTSSQYRSGVTQSLSESSLRILDKFTNILPTFVIREGARNNIDLPFNLWLPDYSKHTMKGEM